MGGDLHHNGTLYRPLLIQWKDRVPNRNVLTIRRFCAASLVGAAWVGGRCQMHNRAFNPSVRRWLRNVGVELSCLFPLSPVRQSRYVR
jgi:hypothetical protein